VIAKKIEPALKGDMSEIRDPATAQLIEKYRR
jgi:hypothetical protein